MNASDPRPWTWRDELPYRLRRLIPRWWCRWVQELELKNHPYEMRWRDTASVDCDDTHWGPVSERLCNLADFLTGGYAHD